MSPRLNTGGVVIVRALLLGWLLSSCGGVEALATCAADADCPGESSFCDLRYGLCAAGSEGRYAGVHWIKPEEGSRWTGEVPLEVELELKPGRERKDPEVLFYSAVVEGPGERASGALARVSPGRYRGRWVGKGSCAVRLQAHFGALESEVRRALFEASCAKPVLSDPLNCGECDRVCPGAPHGEATCAEGQCGLACADGYSTRCGEGCVDLSLAASCGGECARCGEVIAGSHAVAAGCCAHVDPASGSCVAPCAAGAGAEGCRCALVCQPGFHDCEPAVPGCETRSAVGLQTEGGLLHCGACGRTCRAPPRARSTCEAGACGSVCEPGFLDCNRWAEDGCETEVSANPRSCGGCGVVCPAAPPRALRIGCQEGRCRVLACEEPYEDQNGDPADGCEHNPIW
jgi:hypothetical protein